VQRARRIGPPTLRTVQECARVGAPPQSPEEHVYPLSEVLSCRRMARDLALGGGQYRLGVLEPVADRV
jgi:hypothetical protein